MFEISNERFEELAAEAVASLPKELSVEIDNVAIVWKTRREVAHYLGCQGIP